MRRMMDGIATQSSWRHNWMTVVMLIGVMMDLGSCTCGVIKVVIAAIINVRIKSRMRPHPLLLVML